MLCTRVSLKAPLVILKLLTPIFLFHLVQSFRFFWEFFSTIFSTPGNFWPPQNHKGSPLGWKIGKNVRMFISRAQKMGFDALNTKQNKKTKLCAKCHFWKKIYKNPLKMSTWVKICIMIRFFLIFFRNGNLHRAEVFYLAFSASKLFFWAI